MEKAEQAGNRPLRVLSTATFKAGLVAVCAWVPAAMPAAADTWRIVRLNDAAAVEGAQVRFDAEGAFSGTTGCNNFQGRARFEENALLIDGPVATTRMACPGDALTFQDDAIVGVFGGRVAVAFDPLSGILGLSNGDMSLELVPLADEDPMFSEVPATHAGMEPPAGDPPYLNPFGLADDMPIRAEPDAASRIVGGAFSGQVLRNEGCEGAWCRVASLDGSLAGWAERRSLEASDSTLRAGQGVFDAAGLLPCAKGIGAPMTRCTFGVARDGGGNATVVVDRSDGLTRALFFANGALLGADTSEADGGHEVSVAREGDLFLIRVNDERYEIPDAVVRGG